MLLLPPPRLIKSALPHSCNAHAWVGASQPAWSLAGDLGTAAVATAAALAPAAVPLIRTRSMQLAHWHTDASLTWLGVSLQLLLPVTWLLLLLLAATVVLCCPGDVHCCLLVHPGVQFLHSRSRWMQQDSTRALGGAAASQRTSSPEADSRSAEWWSSSDRMTSSLRGRQDRITRGPWQFKSMFWGPGSTFRCRRTSRSLEMMAAAAIPSQTSTHKSNLWNPFDWVCCWCSQCKTAQKCCHFLFRPFEGLEKCALLIVLHSFTGSHR